MISTHGRYAIDIMIDLAENEKEDGGFIPLKDIAARRGLSKKYLEIIVRNLVNGGLIIGASGKRGGYRLSRRPEDFSVGEILDLTEGSLSPVSCLANPASNCPRKPNCLKRTMWAEMDRMVYDYLHSKKLSDLCRPSVPEGMDAEECG